MHDRIRIAKLIEDSDASETMLQLCDADLALVARVGKLLHSLLEVYDIDMLQV